MTARLLALTVAALLVLPLWWRLGGAIETAPLDTAKGDAALASSGAVPPARQAALHPPPF